MKAGVWTGLGELVCQDWPEPELGADTVLVRVTHCGMCGSDSHIVEGELRVGTPPQVLGHEVSGIVEYVGPDVYAIDVGARVACNYFGNCGRCPWCLNAQPNHCRRKVFGASGYAELAAYREDQVFTLPDDVRQDEGALLEPLATCLYAVEESGLRSGESALIIGAGPIGLLTAQLAALFGAGKVVVSELDPAKRAVAASVGVSEVVDPTACDLTSYARDIGSRRGFDVIYDAAGSSTATTQALELLAARGRLMVIAVHNSDVAILVSPNQMYQKELVVKAANSTAYTFQRAVPLLSQLQLRPLISATEPLSDISDVYRRHRAGEFTKVLLSPDGDG